MDYRELAHDLLKQAATKGTSGAEVIIVEDEAFSVQVRMRAVDTLKSAREKRLGLRLCFGQRSATTATSDFSLDSLRRLLDDTAAMARAAAEDPFSGLPEPEAVALATSPKLLLLDEPTAGMSPEETQRMTRMLEGLPREVTLLIIEHDMDVVSSLADRVTVLHYGEVLAEGTFDEVKADPRVYEVYLGGAG